MAAEVSGGFFGEIRSGREAELLRGSLEVAAFCGLAWEREGRLRSGHGEVYARNA